MTFAVHNKLPVIIIIVTVLSSKLMSYINMLIIRLIIIIELDHCMTGHKACHAVVKLNFMNALNSSTRDLLLKTVAKNTKVVPLHLFNLLM